MGTVDYMSPEQARDPRSTDARSDLYSLGCTLFALVSGRPPYATDGGTLATLLLSHQTGPIPDVRTFRPETPDDLARLIRRLMDRDPAMRPQTAAEVARLLSDIRPVKSAPSARAKPRRRWLAIPAMALLAGLGLAFWPSNPPEPLPVPPLVGREEVAEFGPMPREKPPIDRKRWQILGPYLYPDLRTAADSPYPFASLPIDGDAKYRDGERELVWRDAGALPRLSVSDVAGRIPADREGVYYLRGWTRLRAVPATVEWDALKCSYKMKLWIEGECINDQYSPLVTIPKTVADREYYDQVYLFTIPKSAKADWSEVVVRVLVSPKARVPLELTTVRRWEREREFGYFERE